MDKLSGKPLLFIGEAMVELRQRPDGLFEQAIAGDVYNTAVYLKRLLGETAQVTFFTGLGHDGAADLLRASADREGMDLSPAREHQTAPTGLYMIRTDAHGERSFDYWRSGSAAARMLESDDADSLAALLSGFGLVHLSGITLAILSDDHARLLLESLERVAESGTTISFDTNFRERLWTDKASARALYARMLSLADIAFPGLDDLAALYGDDDAEAAEARLAACKGLMVLKAGESGMIAMTGEERHHRPFTPADRVVDTTAAGDSFAAGFLAGWLNGAPLPDCLERGDDLAKRVIAHPGAIISRDEM